MDTKIGAYEVAAENVAMGIDLVTTASDIVSQMQDKGERLRSLCVQARNGTYGTQSLEAINSEAQALVSEINRLYTTSEYNNMRLFDMANSVVANQVQTVQTFALPRSVAPEKPVPKAEYNGFISDPKSYDDSYVNSLTSVSSATLTSGGKYKIATQQDLLALRTYANAGNDTSGMTFILANDIDMFTVSNWTSILNFKGTLDGNGYSIENLSYDAGYYEEYQGTLFDSINSSAKVKNLCLKELYVYTDTGSAGLCSSLSGLIENCYTTGELHTESMEAAGLVSNNYGIIKDCYTECSFNSVINSAITSWNDGSVINCYANADVCEGVEYFVYSNESNISNIENCYFEAVDATVFGFVYSNLGNIISSQCFINIESTGSPIGGIVGYNRGTISNCIATCNIIGESIVGGLAGANYASGTITNCEFNGSIEGKEYVGGLVGYNLGDIIDSSATGTVTGINYVGGLVGYNEGNIINSNTSGTVSGTKFVGGLVGQVKKTSGSLDITNCGADSTVTGSNVDSTGNFIGGVVNTTNETTFGTVNISGCTMLPESATAIGGCFKNTTKIDYDMSAMLAGINAPQTGGAGGGGAIVGTLRLQVGVDGKGSSGIFLDTTFGYDLSFLDAGVEADGALEGIDLFINTLSEKMTHYGTITNRLESALDTISVNQENLISSLSTIRDADMSEVSATYIQQQILQQASATLMATANQTPAIALQLI